MPSTTQRDKAVQFRSSHSGPEVLVLPNAWDAASACIFEQAGFAAIATTSSGVAATLGYLREIAHALLEQGTYTTMNEKAISGAELRRLFEE